MSKRFNGVPAPFSPASLASLAPAVLSAMLGLSVLASLARPSQTVSAQTTPDTNAAPQPPPAAQTAPGGGPAGEAPRPRRPMPAPVNLQVLPKETTVPELMNVMHTFESQVGVECGFCHASDPATHRLNFASDAKPEKATARVMMRMTNDINQKYLTQINDPDHADHPAPPVTCGTCHRGQSMPAAFTPVTEEEHHGAAPGGMNHGGPPPPPS